MKNYLFSVFCIVVASSNFAFASVYKVKFGVSIENQDKGEMSLTVQEGQKGTISQESNGESTSIEVTAEKFLSDDGVSTVALDIKLIAVGADGVRTLKAQPKIITFLNEKAEVSQKDDAGKNIYKLSVVASEVQ